MTLHRKIAQLKNSNKDNKESSNIIIDGTNSTTTTTNSTLEQLSFDENYNQALKNLTNIQNDLPTTTNSIDSNLNQDFLIDSENTENNTTIVNSGSSSNSSSNDNSSNNIAGSMINSADISLKVSEYINSNLPQIEKSINNHLKKQQLNSDSMMSLNMNDLKETPILNTNLNDNSTTTTNLQITKQPFIKTHRKQLSDESFHNVHIYRNNSEKSSSNNQNQSNSSSSSNKRSIKKTRVSL